MSDLLQEMETTLGNLKLVGQRADELQARAARVRQRVDDDRGALEARSRQVVPRAQELASRMGRTQEELGAAFNALTSKVRGYRQSLGDLHGRCRQETNQLQESVGAVQLEHEILRSSMDELQQNTHKAVFDHGTGAQTGLQSIAPGMDGLDAHLRDQVLPFALSATEEVVRLSNSIGREVHQTLVPALAKHTQNLQNKLETGADDMRKKATKLAQDLDNKSKQLMKEAKKAAQEVHDRSNGRFLRLLGEVELTGKAMRKLIASANKALSGLHSMRRRAMGVVRTIISIVDKLLDLLNRIVQGVKIA